MERWRLQHRFLPWLECSRQRSNHQERIKHTSKTAEFISTDLPLGAMNMRNIQNKIQVSAFTIAALFGLSLATTPAFASGSCPGGVCELGGGAAVGGIASSLGMGG